MKGLQIPDIYLLRPQPPNSPNVFDNQSVDSADRAPPRSPGGCLLTTPLVSIQNDRTGFRDLFHLGTCSPKDLEYSLWVFHPKTGVQGTENYAWVVRTRPPATGGLDGIWGGNIYLLGCAGFDSGRCWCLNQLASLGPVLLPTLLL